MENFMIEEKKITINELVNEKVNSYPQKVFIKSNGTEYTWLDIDMASHIIAQDLYEMGAREGTHIGICGTNSINLILTFFAIHKLNAVSVFLNPALKPKEAVVSCDAANIEIMCCGELQNDLDAEIFVELINKEEKNKKIKCYSFGKELDYKKRFNEFKNIKGSFRKNLNSSKSSVFLFTSGSTGTPKVVMHSSTTMVYRAYGHIKVLNLKEHDVHCLVSPLFHIFALDTVFFPAAVSNAKIVLPVDLKTSTIIKTIREEKCTNFNAVTTMMLAIVSNKNHKNGDFESIKLSMIAGAITSPKQMKMFSELMPNNRFINIYGLTEFCPCTYTEYRYGGDSEILKTVGKPYPNISLMIQNNINKTICKQGETGEIMFKGYGAMDGYYNLPKEEQTIDDNGWFHTGDLGFINEEGNLCISGRLKEIIIRSAENIMPQEIATVIEQNECIKEVKVIGVPDDFRGEEIAACISLNDGFVFDEERMRENIGKNLSKYKIPRYFIIYDEIPKLVNGKVDVVNLKKTTIDRINKFK